MNIVSIAADGRSAWRHRRRRVRFADVAAQLGLDDTWDVVPTEGDTIVAIGPDLIVKTALTPTSSAGLHRHRTMIERLHLVGIGDLAPRIVEHGHIGGLDYLIETRCAGRPLPRSTDPAVIGAAAHAVGTLHRATALRGRVDADVFERIVGVQLARIAGDPRVRAPHSAVRALRETLHDALGARSVTLSTVHGDHWSSNVIGDVATADTGRESSVRLVDWENGVVVGLPELDHVHYVMALHPQGVSAARHGLAATPATIGEWLGGHVDWLADATPNPELPAAAVIVATWIHHVAAGLSRASQYATSARWVRTHAAPLFAPDVIDAVCRTMVLEHIERSPAGTGR